MTDSPKPCVAVLVSNASRILLARRAFEPAKGQWDIPGGFIEAGETAEEAAIREILEETGLHIRITRYLGSIADVYGDKRTATINFCFVAEVVGGEEKAQSDVASLEWFTSDRLPTDMAFAHQYQVLEWYRKSATVA